MAMVGANQWRGGYMQNTDSFEPPDLEPDSYLGKNKPTVTYTCDLHMHRLTATTIPSSLL